MLVEDIEVVEDVLMVVGQKMMGLFPFGIDPRLIDEEFNGFMMLSSLERVKLIHMPFVVGASRNKLQYGELFLSNEAGLNCHIEPNSRLKY